MAKCPTCDSAVPHERRVVGGQGLGLKWCDDAFHSGYPMPAALSTPVSGESFFEDEGHNEYGERGEERLLRILIGAVKELSPKINYLNQRVAELSDDIANLRKDLQPKLVAIELRFGDDMSQGPVTLTPSAKSTKATVLGFDATGAPFTGTMPSVTFTPDVTTFATFTGDGANGDDIVGSADGTTNLAASLTTAEDLALSDTSQVITSGFTGGGTGQKLASIKLDFSTPV